MSFEIRALVNGVGRIVTSMVFGATGLEAFALIKNLQESQTDLDKQIQKTVGLLSKSSQLITTLETTLKERENKLRTLQQEYKRLEGLTTLTAEQSRAITDSLSQLMGRSAKKERWVAFGINIVAGLIIFVLGVFSSDPVKRVPNYFKRSATISAPTKPLITQNTAPALNRPLNSQEK